jgi:uncharacterized membrane protein
VAILGHAINNGVAAASFLLGWQAQNDQPPDWMLASGAVLLVVGGYAALRVLSLPSPHPAEEVRPDEREPAIRHRRAVGPWIFWVLACAASAVRLIRLPLR